MSASEPWTVGRLLQWTADYLKGHGSESPRLDAELLLAQALGCKRIELYTAFDALPAEEARAALEATRKTLEKAQASLGAVDGTLGGTEPLGHQLISTLQDLAAAARSVQTLADYLDRHPEALLKGKGNPGGK